MAKAPNIRGHKLKVGKQKGNTVSGSCSCGGWNGSGASREELQQKWSKNHVNKFDTYR